jgi:hypothetical protein
LGDLGFPARVELDHDQIFFLAAVPVRPTAIRWNSVVSRYQLDLVTPGSSPACAISRRQIRHNPNLR